jgi:hypothetical protein
MPYRIIAAIVASLALAAPNVALAQIGPIVPPCATAQGAEAPGLDCVLLTFANIAQIILGVTGSLALLMFVYGGFMMLSSGGSEDKISKGKDAIRSALIGIAIILTAGALISYGLRALGVKGDFVNSTGTSDSGSTSNVADCPPGQVYDIDEGACL